MSVKKWTLVPFIVAASCILLILYFLTIRQPGKPEVPLRAVPLSTAMLIQVNNLEALMQKSAGQNALFEKLIPIPAVARLNRQMRFLDSLFRHVPETREFLSVSPSYISIHLTGREKLSAMHILTLPPRMNAAKVNEIIGNLVGAKGTLKKRNYEGVDLNEAALLSNTGVDNFAYVVTHNLLIISFSSLLLEDAVNQLIGGGSVADLPGFQEIFETAGKNVDANLFVNFAHFPRLLSSFVSTDYKAEVRSVKNFAAWAELDVNLLTDKLLMNGFVAAPDSAPSLMQALTEHEPAKIGADKVLPASVSAFFVIAFGEAERYFSEYQQYLRNTNQLTTYRNTLSSLTHMYGTDFLQLFISILGHEAGVAFAAIHADSLQTSTYVFMQVKSQAQAREALESVLEKIASAESVSAETYKAVFRLDNETEFPVYRLPVRRMTQKLFGPLFSGLDTHYFTLVDDYLVFSDSYRSLASVVRDFVLSKTLENDRTYRQCRDNLSPRSNLFLYANLGRSAPVFSTYLTAQLAGEWADNLPAFSSVQGFGLQLLNNNGLRYANVLLQHTPGADDHSQTLWESKLDTLAAIKPAFVLNHTTRRNEVFVQDLRNNIYLINQVGRVLWKVQLPEPILSDVFQVDYYKNGKLQLLFSTRNHIYLVDRNGNFVEKYPVKLRAPATAGVAVVDYDRNRDYRLFIPTADNQVYVYTISGQLLPGWKFAGTESEVSRPVSHFRIADKDFVVLGDRFRTYILDRKGNSRITGTPLFPRSPLNGYSLNYPGETGGPSLVTTDTAGIVHFIFFNGEMKTLDVGRFGKNHYFSLVDLQGDGDSELIFADEGRLQVFNLSGQPLFSHRFSSPELTRPQLYQFSARDRMLGLTSPSDNRIYLFDAAGKIYPGFPLQGNTPFSISQFGDTLARFNLVVGSNDHFLYNYRLR